VLLAGSGAAEIHSRAGIRVFVRLITIVVLFWHLMIALTAWWDATECLPFTAGTHSEKTSTMLAPLSAING
jgi:hypothetical protein